MRIVLVLAFFGLSVAAPTVRPCKTITGTRYQYKYEADTKSGIPNTSPHASGVILTATVWLTVSDSKDFAVIEVKDALITPVSPSTTLHSSKQFSELSKYTVAFKLENGHVVEIYPNIKETEQILNIKRGIISAFQIPVTGNNGVHTVQETDILGTCMTTVTKFSVSDDEITISKHRDLETCSRCDRFTILRLSENQEAKFVGGRLNAEYSISSEGVIQSASLEQVESLSPLSADAGEVITFIWQNLMLVGEPSTVDSLTVCPELVTNLNFSCSTCLPRDPEECMPDAENLIELMADSPPHDIPHHFIELIQVMKKCSKLELGQLKDRFVRPKVVDAESGTKKDRNNMEIKKKHTFFLDALVYVGTEAAMDFIVELSLDDSDNSLNDPRKEELALGLGFMPVHSTCPCLILKRALDITKKRVTHMIPKLVVGAVINKALEMPGDVCTDLIEEAVKFLETSLTNSLDNLPEDFDLQADESTYTRFMTKKLLSRNPRQIYDDAVHTIKALGNAGVPKTLKILIEASGNMKLQVEGRTAAVYALQSVSRRAPNKVRDITLEILNKTTEEQEIRIAAFLTFMRSVTSYSTLQPKELFRLMQAIVAEPDSYVKSFVCTYMMAVDRSEDPTIRTLRGAVHYLLKISGLFLVCPAADKGYFSSKATRGYVSLADANLPRSLPRDVMGIGFSMGVLANEPGWLPRSASGKVTANWFGYDMELFEVGVRGTGLQKLISHLFGPTGYLRKGTRDMGPSGLSHSMELDVSEDIGVSAYLKFLGQEIGWKQWEENSLMRMLYDRDNLTTLRKTLTDITFGHFDFGDISDIWYDLLHYLHYAWEGEIPIWHDKINVTKTARFLDVKRIVPTIIGMPLNLTAKAAGHIQLDAEAETSFVTMPLAERIRRSLPAGIRNWFPSTNKFDEIHAWAEVSPKFSVMSSVNLTLDAYHFKPKVVFVANATSNFTQRINATLDENYKLNIKFLEVPESETWLLNASYTQFGEVDGSRFILNIDKYNETMLYEPIGSELFNIALYSNITYPNSTGIDQAPFFPLSGPASLILSLEKDNDGLEMVEFQLWNLSEISLDEGQFDIELTPVGTEAGIKGYARWSLDNTMQPARKVVEVDLDSSPGTFSSVFYGNTKKRMDIEGFMSLVTDVSNTTASLRFNRNHFYGIVHRVRHSPEPWNRLDATINEPIFTIPQFQLEVDGSLANNTHGNTSVMLFLEGSDEPQWLRVNYTVLGLMVNISATSSLFHNASLFYVLPYPLKSPICHVFGSRDTHLITFDGHKQQYNFTPGCEYVLARHRHDNDTFAVTRIDKDVVVYINGTKYTLTPDYTMFKVGGRFVALPYKQKHIIQVRKVEKDGHQYVRLSAWAGVDIYYSDGDIQLAVNGFYINQTAGLCGNANYDDRDDLMLPTRALMQFAESKEEMASEWRVSCHETPTPTPELTECNVIEDSEKCSLFFLDILSDVHFHVGLAGFYNACLDDVKFCRGPYSSIRAYLRAAHAKQVNVAGCLYGDWSDWSDCTHDHQYRVRPVLENPFREVCLEQKERRVCERKLVDGSCSFKGHAYQMYNSKLCSSVRPVQMCASECVAVYEMKELQFKCAEETEYESKIDNVSPVNLPYNKYVVSCKKTQ